MLRNERLSTMVTPEERERFTAAARRTGETLSRFLSRAAKERCERLRQENRKQRRGTPHADAIIRLRLPVPDRPEDLDAELSPKFGDEE